jgi:uridine kinase
MLKVSFENLIAVLHTLPRKCQTLIVGIEGGGGSGKSTFAKKLQLIAPDITVVHIDDFYLPARQRPTPEIAAQLLCANFDWQRLENQVLKMLQNNQCGHYQRYDWPTDKLAEWHNVPTGGMVIVEGISSIRIELADFYDFKIWIECPADLRLARGIERDGENARPIWEDYWMPEENRYWANHKPFDSAHIVVDGSGSLDHTEDEFICVSAKNGLFAT